MKTASNPDFIFQQSHLNLLSCPTTSMHNFPNPHPGYVLTNHISSTQNCVNLPLQNQGARLYRNQVEGFNQGDNQQVTQTLSRGFIAGNVSSYRPLQQNFFRNPAPFFQTGFLGTRTQAPAFLPGQSVILPRIHIPCGSIQARHPSYNQHSFMPQGSERAPVPIAMPSTFSHVITRSLHTVNKSLMSSMKRSLEESSFLESSSRNIMEKRARCESTGVVSQEIGRNAGRGNSQHNHSSGTRLLNRRWTQFGASGKVRAQDTLQFSLMSYNVLAQNLLHENMYLYRKSDQQYLDWTYRKWNLIHEIWNSKCDVVCLQEVHRDHFQNFFMPEMNKKGFVGIFKQRTGKKLDGCAIFYNRYKFKASAIKPITFFRHGSHLLDRDNVGVVVLLQSQTGKTPFHVCVATTHLLFNPRRGDIKLCQLAILLAEMDKLSKRIEDGKLVGCPLILCGDMNSTPQSNLIQFLNNGELDLTDLASGDISGQYESNRGRRMFMNKPPWLSQLEIDRHCQYDSITKERARLQNNTRGAETSEAGSSKETRNRNIIRHPFDFKSVYSLHPSNQEVSSNHSKTNCLLDYIFYASGVKSNNEAPVLEPMGKLDLLTGDEADRLGGLPSKTFSSDHFSLVAEFVLKSHAGFDGSDSVDVTAKWALMDQITNKSFPFSDFRPLAPDYIITCSQEI